MRTPDIEVMDILIHLTDYFNKLAELNNYEPFIENMIKEALYIPHAVTPADFPNS